MFMFRITLDSTMRLAHRTNQRQTYRIERDIKSRIKTYGSFADERQAKM